MSGKIDNGTPTNAHRETFKANLKYAATQLEQADIIGVLEPINHYSIPGYFLNDYKFALQTIHEVGSRNIKLMTDIFHMQLITGNISNNLKELAPFIGHVQIAQAPKRNEPDSDGELNYRYILNEISSIYDDFIGLEYTPLTTTSAGLKWINNFGYTL
jgi:hydroxypyruvate isomerase